MANTPVPLVPLREILPPHSPIGKPLPQSAKEFPHGDSIIFDPDPGTPWDGGPPVWDPTVHTNRGGAGSPPPPPTTGYGGFGGGGGGTGGSGKHAGTGGSGGAGGTGGGHPVDDSGPTRHFKAVTLNPPDKTLVYLKKFKPDPKTWSVDDLLKLSTQALLDLLSDPRYKAIVFALLALALKKIYNIDVPFPALGPFFTEGWDTSDPIEAQIDQDTMSAWSIEMDGFWREWDALEVSLGGKPGPGYNAVTWPLHIKEEQQKIYDAMMAWEWARYDAEVRLKHNPIYPPDPWHWKR